MMLTVHGTVALGRSATMHGVMGGGVLLMLTMQGTVNGTTVIIHGRVTVGGFTGLASRRGAGTGLHCSTFPATTCRRLACWESLLAGPAVQLADTAALHKIVPSLAYFTGLVKLSRTLEIMSKKTIGELIR